MSISPFRKKIGLTFLAIFLSISMSILFTNVSYAYVEFAVSGSHTNEDPSITSSQSSLQGSYCYAPPNATIINSCNSGDMSSSENTGLNLYNQ